jgi:hypothetical protein
MMGGYGQFGYITMGGMFTLLKIRETGEPGNYENWYKHPAGEVAMAASKDDLNKDGISVD